MSTNQNTAFRGIWTNERSPLCLTHEVGDNSVEGGALVAEALLSSAQGTEVLGSLGDHVIAELSGK